MRRLKSSTGSNRSISTPGGDSLGRADASQSRYTDGWIGESALVRTLLPLWLLGCAGAPDLEAPAVDLLSAQQRAVRISVALRGVPPSASESALVQANPAMLPVLVDAWLDDERFGETVKDLYAEALDIRADTRPIVPAIGELEDVSEAAIFRSVSEAPLRLIADVVMSDRPLTDIFSEPQVYADELLVRIYGLQGWDPDGEEVQRLDWVDGRPEAGILASSALWMRHESNGSNYHRGRANLVSTVFACDDIGSRDIVIP